jgi:hypothetical protein
VSPRNSVSLALSAVLAAVGFTLTVLTLLSDEGSGVKLGYILGPALTLAGLGRGWLAWQMRRRR